MSTRLVCLCNFVTETEINSALNKGALTTTDIQLHTKAGTTCGKCLPEVDSIVEDYLNRKPKDMQTKLNF